MIDIDNIFDSIKKRFPILKRLNDSGVFDLLLLDESDLTIVESCDGVFSTDLNVEDCEELGNVFFELAKFLKALKVLGVC